MTLRTLLVEAADALNASPSRTVGIEVLLGRIEAALAEDREALDEITLTNERDSARHDHAKAVAERDEARTPDGIAVSLLALDGAQRGAVLGWLRDRMCFACGSDDPYCPCENDE